jgi:hypothetical protein
MGGIAVRRSAISILVIVLALALTVAVIARKG